MKGGLTRGVMFFFFARKREIFVRNETIEEVSDGREVERRREGMRKSIISRNER